MIRQTTFTLETQRRLKYVVNQNNMYLSLTMYQSIMSACARWKDFQERAGVRGRDVKIAEIIGITHNLGNAFPAVITKYYPRGNILDFLNNEGVNLNLVSVVSRQSSVPYSVLTCPSSSQNSPAQSSLCTRMSSSMGIFALSV